jgi:ligand-binding SRPBCC domain-containing protein
MKIFEFSASQFLPQPRGQLFTFFSDASNLEAITPPWLKFRITSPQPVEIREGSVIDYSLRVHGVPLRWRTLIKAWEPPERFIDEQVHGPYRLWHHEHVFEAVEGGTRIHDRIRYSPIGGALVQRLFVKRDVERIFGYRARQLELRFGVEAMKTRKPAA